MNKIILVCLTALGLAACDQMPCRDNDFARTPDPTKPKVHVVTGSQGQEIIVIDQEPIVFTRDQVNVTVTWHLPKQEHFRFPENGIVVHDNPQLNPKDKDNDAKQDRDRKEAQFEFDNCHASADGLEYSCLFRHTIIGKTYKYTIRVDKFEKGIRVRNLEDDPHMIT